MTLLEKVKTALQAEIKKAVLQAGWAEEDALPEIMLETPREKEHGDLATNIAMQLTRIAKKPPREIAETIVRHLDYAAAGVDRVEIAGPGFINFFMKQAQWHHIVIEALQAGENFGRVNDGQGQRVNVEFVSANPTGRLHLGHARGAAVGDALCRILEFAGYDVTREYYINDAGNQIANLALSLEARYRQALGLEADMPEDGYYGEDIVAFAHELKEKEGDRLLSLPEEERLAFFRKYALEREMELIRQDLERFRVRFDVWFSETSLYENKKPEEALQKLRERGRIYEKDGAVWLQTTAYGDDKDRVVVKQDGTYTYLMPDIAYHQDKYNRGFQRLINIWGADHHGYVPRLKAAVQTLGYEPEQLEVLLGQMVSLYKNGEKVKMSKRTGQAVTIAELMDEVGVDAIRYFFAMRSLDSQLDFDLDLAVAQSNENPVFYVQYAHARICSVFRQADEQNVPFAGAGIAPEQLAVLDRESEHELMLKIAAFPQEVSAAAQQLAPHRIVRYVYELATLFHSYYRAERVITDDLALTQARLALLGAIRIVIANALGLIGVSAPERM